MAVTLVLTRKPLRTFTRHLSHGDQSGRWGTLIAVSGPTVTAAQMTDTAPGPNSSPRPSPPSGPGPRNGGTSIESITVDPGVLRLTTNGVPVTETKQYTSMERFHADGGRPGDYVRLPPKPDPYWITYDPHNSAVMHLRSGHAGRCFRVHGGRTLQEQSILIHEAPNVGWVTGCISPRPLRDFTIEMPNDDSNTSYQSMDELFQFVGVARANLFVLD